MKLVDILARNLPEWPAGVDGLVQYCDGQVCPIGSNPEKGPKVFFELSHDWETEGVVRHQWQAAVDALKATNSSESCPECERRSKPAIGEGGRCGDLVVRNGVWVKEDWTGEGLPPVGVVCEVDGSAGPTGWGECTIRYVSDDVIVFKRAAYGFESFSCIGEDSFRQIRTPEQIAAEEMSEGVQAMRQVMAEAKCGKDAELEALWLAGYRKFEIVEGE
jgi:hypothetical protein